MIAQTVQLITERGVQTSTSGEHWWAILIAIALIIGWGYFAISMCYWRPRN